MRGGAYIKNVMPTTATMRHLPNALTVTRILLTPLVLLLLTWKTPAGQGGALLLFMAASASDYFDGRLARSYGARSRLGKFLDPLADKVLVLGTFITLAALHPAAVPWWAVALIALRDAGVTGLRTYAESRGHTLPTLPLAKSKTTAQLFYLVGMLALLTAAQAPALRADATWVLERSVLPLALLLLVVALTLFTGALYLLPRHLTPLRDRSKANSSSTRRNPPRPNA